MLRSFKEIIDLTFPITAGMDRSLGKKKTMLPVVHKKPLGNVSR